MGIINSVDIIGMPANMYIDGGGYKMDIPLSEGSGGLKNYFAFRYMDEERTWIMTLHIDADERWHSFGAAYKKKGDSWESEKFLGGMPPIREGTLEYDALEKIREHAEATKN